MELSKVAIIETAAAAQIRRPATAHNIPFRKRTGRIGSCAPPIVIQILFSCHTDTSI